MTRKTVGVDPKVPAQLIAAALAWLIAHFAGIGLSPELEAAIAALIGAIAGALAPAPNVITKARPRT